MLWMNDLSNVSFWVDEVKGEAKECFCRIEGWGIFYFILLLLFFFFEVTAESVDVY